VGKEVHLGRLSDFQFVQSISVTNVVLNSLQKDKKINVFTEAVHLIADFLDEPSSCVLVPVGNFCCIS